jgi:hypothetical protein
MYDFGGFVKIWPGQLSVLSTVTDPLPFKTTGIIHIYEFGGCVKIWPLQLCVFSTVTDPVLFHSNQPEYIFMNLEVV